MAFPQVKGRRRGYYSHTIYAMQESGEIPVASFILPIATDASVFSAKITKVTQHFTMFWTPNKVGQCQGVDLCHVSPRQRPFLVGGHFPRTLKMYVKEHVVEKCTI